MLYKNTKAMIHSLNGDFDFFEIVARVLQDYLLQMSIDLMKENGLILKTSSRKYPTITITDDLVLLANKLA